MLAKVKAGIQTPNIKLEVIQYELGESRAPKLPGEYLVSSLLIDLSFNVIQERDYLGE